MRAILELTVPSVTLIISEGMASVSSIYVGMGSLTLMRSVMMVMNRMEMVVLPYAKFKMDTFVLEFPVFVKKCSKWSAKMSIIQEFLLNF